MRIPNEKARAGDILIFKRSGFASAILSWLLQRFEPWWDRWGWHMAIIHNRTRLSGRTLGWWILESQGQGVGINWIPRRDFYKIRAYRRLNKKPTQSQLSSFKAKVEGCNYDVAVYFFTMLQYLILHFFNHPIPRLLDNRWTCWELCALFCREMGKPWQPLHRYPMITDFLEKGEK